MGTVIIRSGSFWWEETDPDVIPDLGIRFQFTIVWATSVATDKTTVLVLHRILASDFWINDTPKMGVWSERRGH